MRPFFSYCRLVPGAKNSGGKTRHKRTKDGNRYLKLASSHAAVRSIQYYPEIKRWYLAKRRAKGPMVARALVAKELARIVYEAFGDIHDHHRFPRDFPSVEAAQMMIGAWIPHPQVWGVLAEADARLDAGRDLGKEREVGADTVEGRLVLRNQRPHLAAQRALREIELQ